MLAFLVISFQKQHINWETFSFIVCYEALLESQTITDTNQI